MGVAGVSPMAADCNIDTHTQYCNTRDVCCTWYLSRSVRSRCAVVCAQLPHPYASPLRSDQASSNAGRLNLRFAALAGAAAAAAESSSEPETSDSEADASGETEEGAEEEDADDAHL